MAKIKLTKRQNDVVYCVQSGWQICTDSGSIGAVIGKSDMQFEIGSRLFWNLVHKGIIWQQHRRPFDYVLTALGGEMETKKVDFDQLPGIEHC